MNVIWIVGKMIGLVEIGDVEIEVFKSIRDSIGERFNKKVEIISHKILLPDSAYNKKRSQYHSTTILNTIFNSMKDSEYEKILGIVDKDLYVEGLNFVFGEAIGIPGRVGVISLIRLRQEFYALPPDTILFLDRVLKEAVHELGHLYGFYHCTNPKCVMYFSNSLLDTDRKSSTFCTKCSQKLKLLIGEEK
jgi:archaemetzincin